MPTQLTHVRIQGERFHADLVGLTPSGKVACLGFVGRRSGVERALVHLHRGESLMIADTVHRTLGEKAYRVLRHPLATMQRLTRAYVLPATAVQQVRKKSDFDDQQESEDTEQVLIWREAAGSDLADSDLFWSWLKSRVAIPVLDAWREPVLNRLRNQTKAPSGDAESTTSEPLSAIEPIHFEPEGDGCWRGMVVRVDDEMMAEAVHAALMSGEAGIPDEIRSTYAH